jgi:transcriptional regulator with XRE-family HTH domain
MMRKSEGDAMIGDYRFKPDVLKYERTRQMLSQQKLAERADLSLGQVSRLEGGKIQTPHFATIEKLARALSIEAEDLFEMLGPA